MQLTTIPELSQILRRAESTIRVDVTRRPHALPPILRVPGSRSILFVDVEGWIKKHTAEPEGKQPAKPATKIKTPIKQQRRQGRPATPAITK